MSATDIKSGPDTVPPGRSSWTVISWLTVDVPSPTASTTHLVCGNSVRRNSAISTAATIGPRDASSISVAACLDALENGSHVRVAETERARLAIERVANIEQWRGDPRLASRFG